MKAFIQHRFKDSDKVVLHGLLSFLELDANALFTQKVLLNDIKDGEDLSDVDRNAQYYQRRLDPKRLKDIKKYIYNAILDEKEYIAVSALFPTSMILSVEIEDIPDSHDGIIDIDFPKDTRYYIVDGQHRLMAMRLLYQDLKHSIILNEDEKYILEYLENYKFGCTLLLNYDLWEQGQVFVNVNFTQKPVNRSLYYDVFGAEYISDNHPKSLERNKIFVAHEITRFMNESKKSPFYKQIRMLGTGHGYVSQAFFVEALLPNFKPSGIWYFDSKSNDGTSSLLPSYKSELFNYFLTIKNAFDEYWGEKDGKVNYISKTSGVGAFTRLLSVFHKQLNYDILNSIRQTIPGEENPSFIKQLQSFLKPLVMAQRELFGPESAYKGTGGNGSKAALYREMIRLLKVGGIISTDDSDVE